jgi:hypothetical protein
MRVAEVGKWVDKDRVATLRRKLVKKTGRKLDDVLKEINSRMANKPGDVSDTIPDNHDSQQSNLPTEQEQPVDPDEEGKDVAWIKAPETWSERSRKK